MINVDENANAFGSVILCGNVGAVGVPCEGMSSWAGTYSNSISLLYSK